ncbi:transducin family protein [Corchorus olitorius]|uniref:Transducin family protein n=1 Tax=Corchorus olitorius TaxID=93759 RepID=A0A1R3HCP5_9ROSI|nr:transducin family protein [Corchorus olitorius]
MVCVSPPLALEPYENRSEYLNPCVGSFHHIEGFADDDCVPSLPSHII